MVVGEWGRAGPGAEGTWGRGEMEPSIYRSLCSHTTDNSPLLLDAHYAPTPNAPTPPRPTPPRLHAAYQPRTQEKSMERRSWHPIR